MQREFFNILKEEHENGTTIFFSSHILSEVQTYCRSAAFIKDGRIIISDKVEKLEQTGTKKVTITGNPDKDKLSRLGDITFTEAANDALSFFYKGDLQKLFSFLASQTLKDVTITEPSLEEIFMNYYK